MGDTVSVLLLSVYSPASATTTTLHSLRWLKQTVWECTSALCHFIKKKKKTPTVPCMEQMM